MPTGMLARDSQLRQDRVTVDAAGGTKSMRTPNENMKGRASHLSRGDFYDYYEELGFDATKEGRDALMANEAEYQGQMGEWEGKLDTAQSQVDTANADLDKAAGDIEAAKSEIPGLQEALSDGWKDVKKSLVPVHLVGGTNADGSYIIEGTYYLQNTQMPGLLEAGMKGGWADDGSYNMSVQHSSGKMMGEEMHTTLQVIDEANYNSWAEANLPSYKASIQSANQQISDAQGMLSGQREQIAIAQGNVGAGRAAYNANQDQRSQQWADQAEAYQRRIRNMNAGAKGFKESIS